MTLLIDGQPYRGVARAATYHAAVDEVMDKLERRTVGHKERPRVRARPDEEKRILRTLADGDTEPGARRLRPSSRSSGSPSSPCSRRTP